MAPCIAPSDPTAAPSMQERAISATHVQSAAMQPQLAPREPSAPKATTTTLEPERPRCRVIDKSIPSHVHRFGLGIYDRGDDDHEYCSGGVNSYAPAPGRPPEERLQPQMVELEACSADPYYSIGFNDGRYEAGVHDGLYGVDGACAAAPMTMSTTTVAAMPMATTNTTTRTNTSHTTTRSTTSTDIRGSVYRAV